MKNQFRIAAILVSVMASGAALSAVTGGQGTGGVVEFSGEIVDSSCNVTTASQRQTAGQANGTATCVLEYN
ncbi:hypothetical protein D8W73_06080 [Citrobacter amalonaticus]|nr:hypothetical protein [Citrobacter amalonaticus]